MTEPRFAESEALDRAFREGWPEIDRAGAATPKSRDEVLAYVRNVVPFGTRGTFDAVEAEVFAMETAIGSEALAQIMTGVLEEISANEWKRASGFVPFYLLGFVLGRCGEDPKAALRARLERMYDRRVDEGGPLTKALDLVLHGAAGARRSADRHGPRDHDLKAEHVLFVDDDPALILAVLEGESFQKWTRRFGARLAFLGRSDPRVLEAVASSWYRVGDAKEQASFLETVGVIAREPIANAIREGAALSKVKKLAHAWCERHEVSPTPRIEPPRRDGDALVICEGDEFGFVLLPHEDAVLLRGEDDHTVLSADADATSPEPIAVTYAGDKRAIFFCLADHVAMIAAEGGGVLAVMFGGDADRALPAFDSAAERDWAPLGTMTLPSGKLVGLSASVTLADADHSIVMTSAPGVYELLATLPCDDEDVAMGDVHMIWLRRSKG